MMKKQAKIALYIFITLIIIISIIVLLLFSFRPDLFINRNCDELSLELDDRIITIPLKCKYMPYAYSPQHCIFETDKNIDDIFLLFSKSVNDNDRIEKVTSYGMTFLYLYTDDVFVQGMSIEPYGDNNRYLRICVIQFIPPTLYDMSDNFEALFQDKSKLVDGNIYELSGKTYPDSFNMMKDYFSHIYETEVLDDTSIKINVDGKKIILRYIG